MTNTEAHYNEIASQLAEEGAVPSQMFGMPTLKIKGKAFAGLTGEAMVFKLTGEAHSRALATKGAKLFEPMAGRPMKEWVVVPLTSANLWPSIAKEALDYVARLRK
ncbi:MAG: hypothetical protein Q8922_01280 [Bacteroidota bacterium]|nr:hypothetical protein [Bacteroidota bacterium]MDP4232140.1 hypothetical protein [Bacteroidota bacterium]MDP4241152.1 hypothetical protein [Bacteroidota bacterium]MDP4286544.1 hypothetical protein [Bacteroidota bacterium]